MNEREIDSKIRDAFASVTPDIRASVLSDCKKTNGKVIKLNDMSKPEKKKAPVWRSIAAVAAALLILAAVPFVIKGFTGSSNKAVASVMIDVNPSIEMTVDRDERVIEAIPRNADGMALLDGMDLSGSKVSVAVNAIVGSLVRRGYLNELANSVLISVDGADASLCDRLREALALDVAELLGKNDFGFAVMSQTIEEDPSVAELAAEYGITVSKAQLITKLSALDPRYDLPSLAALSINELGLISEKKGVDSVETRGASSDLAYIGEDAALAIAYDRAGVDAADVHDLSVDMDLENGIMVYDVEFTANGTEYDVEIDAVTGEVTEFEAEPLETAKPTATPMPTAEPTDRPTSAPTAAPASYIGKNAARDIALTHAGVSSSEAYDIDVELDRENGKAHYDVEFKANGREYEYEIDAVTGEVLDWDSEPLETAKPTTTPKPTAAPVSYIGKKSAKQIAFAHAGVSEADAYDVEAELDRENGKAHYDVEFKANGREYEYEIDAVTGEVLDFESEPAATPKPAATSTPKPTEKPNSSSYIGRAAALEIALSDVGVSVDAVTMIEIEFKRENGKPVYEVEFTCGSTEYEYVIHAETGDIISRSSESNGGGSEPGGISLIGEVRAWEIALDRAGLTMSQISGKEIELDHDNGVYCYEIEFKSGRYEYEIKINAVTGAVMRFDREIDD
ncbi:MAG: PepSY domain-containing protein [Clostridiales bacterium]|nr:PepSY domain-containing protein [Clostridiales bacterium]